METRSVWKLLEVHTRDLRDSPHINITPPLTEAYERQVFTEIKRSRKLPVDYLLPINTDVTVAPASLKYPDPAAG